MKIILKYYTILENIKERTSVNIGNKIQKIKYRTPKTLM